MAAGPEDLAFIERVAGGQPFFTQMAAGYLWNAKANDAPDYDRLYPELQAQIKPHLQHLWTKLDPAEQAALRYLVTPNSLPPDSRHLATLEQRGLIRAEEPFSQLFAEMIAGDDL